ncbi:Ras-induced vulval development antagonist family protein [Theileria parva strain Muguga]|uniref:Ras-induced vulval development antagonist family protein n=1 Tax=Theileria parva strain Muguga TaxID=333668 RepID=UPI001C620278|nr:Ras-induced vulval development antagonist family protein [Theileria parva strain Muguga]EAN32521.2 Ras-induced vulval development antagonist family protein [Theileria parva strain Muguga]
MEKRTKERFRKKIKCEDVYARSRSSSPDVYSKFLENHRKSQELKLNSLKKSNDSTDDENKPPELTDNDNKSLEVPNYSDITSGNDKSNENQESESDSDEEYGPKPLKNSTSLDFKVSYGGELMPGEGDAIAQYIQKGKRIPRRGEVGLTTEQIENFEKIGYVMSGSRHRAINRMRIKKESMVLTAEQERAKALEKYESRMRRENEILNHFREMIMKKQEENNQN